MLVSSTCKSLRISGDRTLYAHDMSVDDIVQDTYGNDYIISIIEGVNHWVLYSDNSDLDNVPPFSICNVTIRPKSLIPKKCKTDPAKPRGRPKKVQVQIPKS